jgi:apolipoprotein N-acyltransferase
LDIIQDRGPAKEQGHPIFIMIRWLNPTKTLILDISSIILSGALLVLTFPRFEVHYLAWISLVPYFLLIKRANALRALLFSLLLGFLFYGGLLWWVLTLDGINPFNFTLAIMVKAIFLGIFGLLIYAYYKISPRWSVVTFPSAWVVIEYLRSHLGFLSSPWGILGYSQYSVLPVIQISAYSGVYGVSFLIVAVNAALTEVASLFLHATRLRAKEIASWLGRKRGLTILLIGFFALSTSSLIYGLSPTQQQKTLRNLKIALVQGNVYWKDRVDPRFNEKVFTKYHQLTLDAANSKPDLVIWPSSSVPGRIPYDRKWVKMLSELANETDNFLLVGSSGFDKFNVEQRKTRRQSNSAFLFSPQGQILARYDKIRLLPFDEYVPLRGYLKWPSWIVSDMNDHLPGKEITIFRMQDIRFGVLICWEYMFPDQFREMSARGVDFMVSMTNEGFVDIASAHYQMLALNVLRAVENHVSIARTASTGVSCVIEPNGRITSRVQDQNFNDVNVEGFQIADLSLSSSRTFYNRWGDWFVYALAVVLIGSILTGAAKRYGSSGEEHERNNDRKPKC